MIYFFAQLKDFSKLYSWEILETTALFENTICYEYKNVTECYLYISTKILSYALQMLFSLSSILLSFAFSTSAAAACLVSLLCNTSGSPLHLHIMLYAILDHEQLHLLELQGDFQEHPHCTMFNTASGAAETPSGMPTGINAPLIRSLCQP